MRETPPPGRTFEKDESGIAVIHVLSVGEAESKMFSSNEGLMDRLCSLRYVCSPSDVMTVLRQLQTFLLAQHSRGQAALQGYILRALLGLCQVRATSLVLGLQHYWL